MFGTLAIAALLAASTAWSGEPAPPAPAQPAGAEAWGAARFGMTPDEVVVALRGEAVHLKPTVNLPDGNVVAVGIDGQAFEGLKVNVRFVFHEGKLALVSLRTLQGQYAEPAAYEATRKALLERWGKPIESASDANFIDMRQTRWDRGGSRVDLKYIPGVVAIVFYPAPAKRPGAVAPSPAPASPAHNLHEPARRESLHVEGHRALHALHSRVLHHGRVHLVAVPSRPVHDVREDDRLAAL
jgi:hypothetical protein